MKILSYNPGHDGAIAYLNDAQLVFSIEAEKNSNYRYSPVSSHDVFKVLGEIEEHPDAICTGGWWPREAECFGETTHVGYRGLAENDIFVAKRRLLGKSIRFFLLLMKGRTFYVALECQICRREPRSTR